MAGCKKAGRNKNSPAAKAYKAGNRADVHKTKNTNKEKNKQDWYAAHPSKKGVARALRRKDKQLAYKERQKDNE